MNRSGSISLAAREQGEPSSQAAKIAKRCLGHGGRLVEASWDEAMELIVARSRELIERYTGSSISFAGVPQLEL
jgi:ferredoxin-nitrate reductase